MNNHVKVPIKVKSSSGPSRSEITEEEPAVVEAAPPVEEQEPVSAEEPRLQSASEARKAGESRLEEEAEADLREELEEWRDRALRLQAEIENFRKRQRRRAAERIEADRGRLLRNFLRVADDLERALSNADDSNAESLREGIEMTHRSLMRLLEQEGVEKIEPQGQSFDPLWHEAVGTVSHEEADVEPNTVASVAQEGYRLDGRLLRPARVVVAT